MADCPNCGAYLYPFGSLEHTLDDCVSNLKDRINELEKAIVNFRVYRNKHDDYPKHGRHIIFDIEGDTYIGGYDDEKELWFSQDGEGWVKNEDVYWMYLISPYSIFEDLYQILPEEK